MSATTKKKMWTNVEKLQLNSEHTQILRVIFAILR